ncbi:Ornithine cyclodeaminase [Vibrio mimicus VM573]|nr:ornithine cyclodeaminase [Vibrio mimicus]EEW10842.1 Ornithine cyclodeaminase [Vibrio mimicus VM573]
MVQKSLDSFLTWVSATFPQITHVDVVDTIEEVVRGSDLITYCNSGETGDPSLYPEVKREWVKPGAFLAMPASCRLDEGMERGDVRKVLDNTGLYQAWYEEVPKPAHNTIPLVGVRFMDMLEEGTLTLNDLDDLGSIVAGETPKRRNDEEIIILSVGGMPVEDVAWATKIYRNAKEKGIGVSLNLWDKPELK